MDRAVGEIALNLLQNDRVCSAKGIGASQYIYRGQLTYEAVPFVTSGKTVLYFSQKSIAELIYLRTFI